MHNTLKRSRLNNVNACRQSIQICVHVYYVLTALHRMKDLIVLFGARCNTTCAQKLTRLRHSQTIEVPATTGYWLSRCTNLYITLGTTKQLVRTLLYLICQCCFHRLPLTYFVHMHAGMTPFKLFLGRPSTYNLQCHDREEYW